jgi:hypothetical protein
MVERDLLKPYDSYLLMMAPIIIGIGLCSLVGFFALGGYGTISNAGYNKGKVMIFTMAPALVVIMGLFIASVAMYLYTPGVGESSGPMMFMEYTHGKPVFIIMKTVDSGSAMAKCGHDLAEVMEDRKMTVHRAYDYGNRCIIDGKEQAGGCTGTIKDASIIMSEGKTAVKSDIFIRPILEITGNKDDFAKCSIEKIYANS